MRSDLATFEPLLSSMRVLSTASTHLLRVAPLLLVRRGQGLSLAPCRRDMSEEPRAHTISHHDECIVGNLVRHLFPATRALSLSNKLDPFRWRDSSSQGPARDPSQAAPSYIRPVPRIAFIAVASRC